MSRKTESKVIFDGIPVEPYGSTKGVNFAVATYYIPIINDGSAVNSIHIQGDGTFAATATVQHSDFERDLNGAPINPRVAGTLSAWSFDAAIGTLTIAASAGLTGSARATWSNQPRAMSRIVLVVSVGGRARGACSGVS